MADNAADVAQDYREALEDLSMNSRVEIATLTNIARENANYGHAIADVLVSHIKKVCTSSPCRWVSRQFAIQAPRTWKTWFIGLNPRPVRIVC